MAYAQQTWVDGAGGATALSADRLNHIEAGIGAAASVADGATTAAAAAQSQVTSLSTTVATLSAGLADAQQTIADLLGSGGGGGSSVVTGVGTAASYDASGLADRTLVVLLSADPSTV